MPSECTITFMAINITSKYAPYPTQIPSNAKKHCVVCKVLNIKIVPTRHNINTLSKNTENKMTSCLPVAQPKSKRVIYPQAP